MIKDYALDFYLDELSRIHDEEVRQIMEETKKARLFWIREKNT